MKPPLKTINLLWLGAVIVTAAILLVIGFARLTVDTDIVASLPTGDPVIADAVYIFKHHPVKDKIAIDIGIDVKGPDRLVVISRKVEQALEQSGLFSQVGLDDTGNAVAALVYHLVDQLPLLFTAADLESKVRPLLTPENIRRQLKQSLNALYGMDGIGQADLIGKDPLGLRNPLLADLSRLIPETTGRIHKGRLISADGKHTLVLATPRHSGTDTRYAAQIAALMETIAADLETPGERVELTPVGAYRAALDNETIIRTDVGRALIGTTIGIALLLLLAFSRPLIGLMALVPALAGTILALFVFALFNDHISIMVLGFGGAIISITVDHGIAYLLFVDSADKITGQQASREIRAIGLLAALTSVGAFATLGLSGFPVFQQLGSFTALGIGFSFLFVHTVFPRIFPGGQGSATAQPRILSRLVDRCTSFGKPAAIGAIGLALVMPCFFNLHFNTDLSAMNSMRQATLAADALVQNVWGNIFSRVHLLVEAQDLAGLQEKNDRLLDFLETQEAAGRSTGGLTASRFFPGIRRAGNNLTAWKRFWSPDRIAAVRTSLDTEASRLGFARNAFDSFYLKLSRPAATEAPGKIPVGLFPLLGISANAAGTRYRQVTGIKPLGGYSGDRMHARLASFVKIFDPTLFSARLGKLLFGTFVKMLVIIGMSVIVLLFIFFADLQLTLMALLPLLFSFSCTLGTLGLLGRPLDIPALMLAIIIFGMGVDYALFMVRAYQRYQDFSHPLFGLTRMAVFMAAVSTLIGFAFICGAQHNTLKSAGVVSFLGIGYCLVGAFLILPPFLRKRFESDKNRPAGDPVGRYRHMEAYPRMFAHFKLKYDPMFTELGGLLPDRDGLRIIIDIGCGYGVPGCWLLERYPAATIYGIEPDPDRVRVATMALEGQGHIARGAAPQIPDLPGNADLAVMLDMDHFLDDAAFNLTLARIREKLSEDGRLILRTVIPPTRLHPWSWWFENLKMKLNKTPAYYRGIDRTAALLTAAGYGVEKQSASGTHGELHWFFARPAMGSKGDRH